MNNTRLTCLNNASVEKGGKLGNQIMRIMAMIGFKLKYGSDHLMIPEWDYSKYFKGFDDSTGISQFPIDAPDGMVFEYDNLITIKEPYFHFTPEVWDQQNWQQDINLEGFFQSPKYWPLKLEFKDEYLNYIKGKYSFDFFDETKTLAITVRRGDFVNHPDYYQLGIDYYLGALRIHFPAYMEKGRVFIFSDDIDWCKQQFDILENVTFIDASDIEQLACMTLCTDFIISNSTFSYVGAYLSDKGSVIRPKQNFRGKKYEENSEKDYWPDGWIVFDDADYFASKLSDQAAIPVMEINTGKSLMVDAITANNNSKLITINDHFAAVFCINLKRRTDRKEQAQKQFDKYGIKVEFIEAVDGEFVQIPAGYKPSSADGTFLTSNELACTASHLKVAQLAQQRNLENYFVFEDDAELDIDFVQRFSDYVKQFSEFHQTPAMFYLGGNHKGGTHLVTKNIARIFETYTTHAYGVFSWLYDAVIESLSEKEKADIALSKLHNQCLCFCTIPHLAFQIPSFSDIENKLVTNNHLRNTNNGGNHNFAYVALDPVSGHVLKQFNYLNTYFDLEFCHPQNLTNTLQVGTPEMNQLFNSGTNIVFLFVNHDLRTADAGKLPELQVILIPKVAGKCHFITINLKSYEFADNPNNGQYFESNLNVSLIGSDFAKFETDIANQLKGYAHTKRFFPV